MLGSLVSYDDKRNTKTCSRKYRQKGKIAYSANSMNMKFDKLSLLFFDILLHASKIRYF